MCAVAGRAGEPLAEWTQSAASTRAMKLFRHMEECAENPEQLQCRTSGGLHRVSGEVRMGLITGWARRRGWLLAKQLKIFGCLTRVAVNVRLGQEVD